MADKQQDILFLLQNVESYDIMAQKKNKHKEIVMKKRIAKVMAMLLAVGVLAGCGSDGDKPLGQLNVDKYVTLGDYNNLNVSVTPEEVTEEQVELTMIDIYLDYVTADAGGITDRAVEVGDTINLDYVGKKDGVAFANGSAKGDQLTIGSGRFIDGFEDGLIGVMPGETVDLDLRFPDGYGNPDLAGQDVVFTVTVNFIMPEIAGIEDLQDEVMPYIEFADSSTVEEFRQFVYDALLEVAQENYTAELQSAIIDELVAQCEFKSLPEGMLEESRKTLTENLESVAAQLGATSEAVVSYYNGMSVEEYVETYASQGVKRNLAFQAIANNEGLAVDDEELQAALEEYVANSGFASEEAFLGDATKEDFRDFLMIQNVIDYLVEKVQANNN